MPSNQPVDVRAVISFDDKTAIATQTETDKDRRVQKGIRKAAWCAFVAACFYSLIAAYQSYLTRKQMRENAESFRIDERAWVEIEPIKPTFLAPADSKFPAIFTCDIYPKNVGKTVARDVVVKAQDLGSSDKFGNDAEGMRMTQDKMLLSEFRESGTDKPVIVPSNPVPRVLAPNNISPVPFRLTCPAPQIFPTGHQALHYLVGRIDYCDQFQIKHWLKFCFRVVNTRGEIWACEEGNDEDRNGEEKTPQNSCANPN